MPVEALSCAARLEAAAGRGALLLSDTAAARVAASLLGRLAPDGGFAGRDGTSDLYYSFFALASLRALGRPLPWDQCARFLDRFGDGDGLDLAHLCCLVRSLALQPEQRTRVGAAAARLPAFVAATGGYRPTLDSDDGSIAATFLALLACEEIEAPLPGYEGIAACVSARRSADGAWADVRGLAHGTTTVTAAVVLMGVDVSHAATEWLVGRHAVTGGFLAGDGAPAADLVSTAAALAALQAAGVSSRTFAEDTLAFVTDLWAADGAFRGYASDLLSDSEFTYYALVTLGVLAGALP